MLHLFYFPLCSKGPSRVLVPAVVDLGLLFWIGLVTTVDGSDVVLHVCVVVCLISMCGHVWYPWIPTKHRCTSSVAIDVLLIYIYT